MKFSTVQLWKRNVITEYIARTGRVFPNTVEVKKAMATLARFDPLPAANVVIDILIREGDLKPCTL